MAESMAKHHVPVATILRALEKEAEDQGLDVTFDYNKVRNLYATFMRRAFRTETRMLLDSLSFSKSVAIKALDPSCGPIDSDICRQHLLSSPTELRRG